MILNSHPRLAATGFAVGVILIAVLSGCAAPGASPTTATTSPGGTANLGTAGPATDSSTAKYGVKLDVVEPGNVLRTTEGRTYQLGANVGYVVRVPVGWLYGRDGQQREMIRLLRPDGSTQQLPALIERPGLDVPATPAVSADGGRIAWADGDSIHVGTLTSSGLANEVTSPVPSGTYPVTWAGSMVVVAQPYDPGCCGYRRVQYDVWDPARGNFVPQWTRKLWPVYGPMPAGRPPFGVEQTDQTGNGCLAQLDGVQNLSVTATACMPGGLTVGSLRGLLSPDGRHLVDGLDDKVQIFDLGTVVASKSALRTCPGDWPRAWEDTNTVLVENTTTKVVTRCFVDGSAPAPVPGLSLAVPGAGSGVSLVPRIG